MRVKRIPGCLLAVVVIISAMLLGISGAGVAQADTVAHLFASAAKESIAPPPDLMPKLLGVMQGPPFKSVAGGLYVRVIAIGNGKDTALFIQYELDQAPFPAETLAAIHKKYGIPEENIFLLGNHGHAAPVTGIRLAEPGRNQMRASARYYTATVAYEKIVLDAMYKAVDEALKTMRPARIGYGSGNSYINEPAQKDSVMPVDTQLFIMKLEDLQGNPIAFLLNYSSHNNAVRLDGVITSDIEGCISHLMENHFKGSVAMWTLAAHGDLFARQDFWNVPLDVATPAFAAPESATNDAFLRMRVLSLRQYEDALRILGNIHAKDEPGAVISGAVDFVDVPTYPVRENKDGSITYMGGTVTMSAAARRNATGRMAQAIRNSLSERLPYRFRMHLTRIGPLAFIGVGGKLYNSYKLRIREIAPLDMETVILSEDSSDLSTVTYILDAHALREAARNGIPGDNNALIKPDSVEKNLVKTTEAMFAKIGVPAY